MKFSAIVLALAASIAPALAFPAPLAEELSVRAVAPPQNFSMYAPSRDSIVLPFLMYCSVRASASSELAAPLAQLGTY
jgi:hypothetical protein